MEFMTQDLIQISDAENTGMNIERVVINGYLMVRETLIK